MADVTLDLPAIRAAARKLEAGELVAFPTETVYGLGADAENPEAVAKIYTAKGRPSNHPVIVHVARDADVGYWADAIPPEAGKLIDAFWPGPLTLILKRAPHIPDAVSGGQDSVGLRCPSHPVAQALLQAFKEGKGGVAAPSANKFGHVSPTTAQHVRDEFGSGPDSLVNCILDGGQSDVGIESTILDLSRMATHGPVLLRPGHISAQRIADIIGVMPRMPDVAAPRASGTLDAHYAPRTPVALVASDELAATIVKLAGAGRQLALIRYSAVPASRAFAQADLPRHAAAYAHELYAALRAMDAARADLIVIEAPPADNEWQGVNDRLRRAAHDSAGILSRLLQ
ncbi:threonylcarbamoyl-AMP synthase [Noviherbaspirillum cavernae]|uniref:Threonylcarbamoyl-AMP synthase n=1 Tax=Noviherbaspirillum cavernae TaxID=2320862 RepID=A0A418WYB1_9BURK|nr:L-threonylcarbamoyladenylate synthase [Noviherbaspirillum cavernae]RJG05224.1 threonylcarbamoyl-AMP synthase [Noviherbaspirillum cavernae]